jgi:hypothetical protein
VARLQACVLDSRCPSSMGQQHGSKALRHRYNKKQIAAAKQDPQGCCVTCGSPVYPCASSVSSAWLYRLPSNTLPAAQSASLLPHSCTQLIDRARPSGSTAFSRPPIWLGRLLRVTTRRCRPGPGAPPVALWDAVNTAETVLKDRHNHKQSVTWLHTLQLGGSTLTAV